MHSPVLLFRCFIGPAGLYRIENRMRNITPRSTPIFIESCRSKDRERVIATFSIHQTALNASQYKRFAGVSIAMEPVHSKS